MKTKIFLSSVLAALLCSTVSAQNSGMFVGVNVGGPAMVSSYSGFLETIKDSLPKRGVSYAVGVSLGYKQALTSKLGVKYYFDYNYNQSFGDKSGGSIPTITKLKADIVQQLLTANMDIYYDFVPSFGMFAGIGVGYQIFKPTWTPTVAGNEMSIGGEQKAGLAVPVNVGLYFNVGEKSQFWLGAKIPLVAYEYKIAAPAMLGNGNGSATFRNYIVQVGYNYTF